MFLIIALGEVVLTTGASIAAADRDAMTVVTGTSALVATVALWALDFGGSEHLVDRHAEGTSDAILARRIAMNGQVIVMAGLIALAVGNELVIRHPNGSRIPKNATRSDETKGDVTSTSPRRYIGRLRPCGRPETHLEI